MIAVYDFLSSTKLEKHEFQNDLASYRVLNPF